MSTHPNYIELRAKVFKALGHPSRLRIVECLMDRKRSVCQIQEIIGSDVSTVSKHLSILKEAGILHSERRNSMIYYSLRMECVTKLLTLVGDFVGQCLEEQLRALRQTTKSI